MGKLKSCRRLHAACQSQVKCSCYLERERLYQTWYFSLCVEVVSTLHRFKSSMTELNFWTCRQLQFCRSRI